MLKRKTLKNAMTVNSSTALERQLWRVGAINDETNSWGMFILLNY